MFYSHQLLARKAPLGQIWMAATLHAKINRKKLDRLNIIKICEEILNPSVPMALRLSGILMGGVVIVYERKVKLLFDDVSRLMVEINEAWKVKAAPDPTLLSKKRSQARKKDVTLPENSEIDVADIEQSLNFSDAATMGFQRVSYFSMRLDNIDEPYISHDPQKDANLQNSHQANAENITLLERYNTYQGNTDTYNRFERFDIEGDDETQMNFTSAEHTQVPTTLISSPTHKDEPYRVVDIEDQNQPPQVNQQSDECKPARQDLHLKRPTRRNVKRQGVPAMDYEQTIIGGHLYQSWLRDASSLVSRGGRKRKINTSFMSTMKITNLMDLPPLVLIDQLFRNGNGDIYYPTPLLDLCTKKRKAPLPLPASVPSFLSPDEVHYQEETGYAFEDIHSGAGSQSAGVSIEKLRENFVTDVPTDLMGELRANLMNKGASLPEAVMVTPRNSGDEIRSIHSSSGSGHDNPVFLRNAEVNSIRSSKKRPYSSSRHSTSLEPVDEENSWQHPDPNFKLSRLSENDPTRDQELLVETGPTPTQRPVSSTPQPIDKVTNSVKEHMKAYFDSPGAPQVESLNNLAAGIIRTKAALLFYQICVLATRDFLRVEQKVSYGDIIMSRGAKM